MTDRVDFYGKRPPEPEAQVWCEWLRRHGVDPSHVLCDFIERREDTYQLVYTDMEVYYSQVPRLARPRFDLGRPGELEISDYEIRRELRKVEKVFQLEAKPLPWPPVPPWPNRGLRFPGWLEDQF